MLVYFSELESGMFFVVGTEPIIEVIHLFANDDRRVKQGTLCWIVGEGQGRKVVWMIGDSHYDLDRGEVYPYMNARVHYVKPCKVCSDCMRNRCRPPSCECVTAQIDLTGREEQEGT